MHTRRNTATQFRSGRQQWQYISELPCKEEGREGEGGGEEKEDKERNTQTTQICNNVQLQLPKMREGLAASSAGDPGCHLQGSEHARAYNASTVGGGVLASVICSTFLAKCCLLVLP